MKKSYKTVKLGDVVTFKTGKLNSNAAQEGASYPFFTCSPETLTINSYAFDEEAILLAGNNANGVFAIKHYKGKFNAYQRTYVITVKSDKNTDISYLFFLLGKSLNFLQNTSRGSATKFLTLSILDNLELSLPPLSSQHRIANILSSFDNKIELLRKENNTLEDIAQSIFKEWFVKAKGQEQINVSDLIEFNPQLSLKKNQISWYIEMADLSTNSSSISRIVKRSYTSGSKFQNNDVLFARVTPCLENGKTCIVKGLGSEDIGWGSTEFIVMRGKDSILYPFVYCLARENQFRQFAQKEMIGTSGRQRVPVNKLQRYRIPQPSKEKLNSFNQISLSVFEEIEKNSRKAEILMSIRNNLLKKLIQ